MYKREDLERLREYITAGQRIILTTHVNPDGDGLGSEAALYEFLSSQGKEVRIFNNSPMPANYQFLNTHGQFTVYRPEAHERTLVESDLILILDISDWERLRDLGRTIRVARVPKICIDHHPAPDSFADVNIIDTDASSTGEIVFEAIKFCGGEVSGQTARALYTSIVTDTGSFRFSNTTPRAHEIAAELIRAGVRPPEMHQLIYEQQSPSKMRLLGKILENLQFDMDGQVVWFVITKEILEQTGARPQDTEGFPDFPRSIAGVQVSLMFLEMPDNRVKVSLRSKGQVVVNEIAQRFGGGGHPFAAGALIEGKLNEVVPKVTDAVRALFSKWKTEQSYG
jgi:phosphoesterase RecJ-like protein